MDRKSIDDTSRKLRELLLEAPYAERWQANIGRRQSHALHQSGICQVIAEYLWRNGLQPTADKALPRKLKDRVYRALGGQSLSLGTLRDVYKRQLQRRCDQVVDVLLVVDHQHGRGGCHAASVAQLAAANLETTCRFAEPTTDRGALP